MNGSVGGSWSRKVTPILNKTIEHTIGQYFTGCSARNELKYVYFKLVFEQ